MAILAVKSKTARGKIRKEGGGGQQPPPPPLVREDYFYFIHESFQKAGGIGKSDERRVVELNTVDYSLSASP